MLNNIINFIINTVGDLGYIGIFIMMFLESSFFPFPSEVVIIPAGYLAYKGKMNLILIILVGIFGSLAGALFNYFLALKFGRNILKKYTKKYGKYFFINENTLPKIEYFFDKHGHISTFSARLIPGIRQYISLPAGLAKMNLIKFIIYTIFGATIWVTILALLGYYIGQNEKLINLYLHKIIIFLLAILAIIVFIYYKKHKKDRKI